MKYFPVFKRKIVIERSDVTAEEIANMMSKIEDIRVMRIDGDCVQCRKDNPSMIYHNSFLPDIKITLVKSGETSELRCQFYLKKSVQIIAYIINFYALAMQIGVLFATQGEIIFPCFIPAIIIAFSLLLSFFGLGYQVRRITEDLTYHAGNALS